MDMRCVAIGVVLTVLSGCQNGSADPAPTTVVEVATTEVSVASAPPTPTTSTSTTTTSTTTSTTTTTTSTTTTLPAVPSAADYPDIPDGGLVIPEGFQPTREQLDIAAAAYRAHEALLEMYREPKNLAKVDRARVLSAEPDRLVGKAQEYLESEGFVFVEDPADPSTVSILVPLVIPDGDSAAAVMCVYDTDGSHERGEAEPRRRTTPEKFASNVTMQRINGQWLLYDRKRETTGIGDTLCEY